MTKAESAFVDQYTRSLMVKLCHNQKVFGSPYGDPVIPSASWVMKNKVYLDHAISKKWLSANGEKVLSVGWMTAARFLKR